MADKKFVVRSRAIIFHEGKLLVISHPHDSSFYALPGGHIEWGEGAVECLKREILEELGIEPEVGRLLYINTFTSGDNIQPFEFFFEVTNALDYLNTEKLSGSHSHEISDMRWLDKNHDRKILPKQIDADLKNGNILSDTVRFINDQ